MTFIIIIVSIVITYYSSQPTIAITTLTILLSKDIEFKKIVKYDMYFKIYITLFTIIFSIIGIIENIKIIRYESGSIIIRNSFGFIHPNTLGTIILLIVIDYIYINYSKLNLKHCIIVCTLVFITKFFTDSRTGLYITIALIVIALLDKSSNLNRKIITKIASITVPYIAILSVIVSIYYNKSTIIQTIDLVLTGRIRLGNIYLNMYPINLFGNFISFPTTSYNGEIITLDNLYIRMLVNFGAIYFLGICFSYYKLGKKYCTNIESSKSILIFSFAFLGISESIGYNICFNISLFLLRELIYGIRARYVDKVIK